MGHAWDNFFLVTGAAGAQLIGLLFVTITLATGGSVSRTMAGIRAFLTPTLVNFAGVFIEAIVVLTPWPAGWMAGPAFGVIGLAGLGYRLWLVPVRRRLEFAALKGWSGVLYDAVPMLANVALIGGGAGLVFGLAFAPFAIAAATLLSVAAGIAGAWDLTLWVIENRAKP